MRHFHIGSELLAFVAANAKGVKIELNPLRPHRLWDLANDVFLQHDLNIYNFIIEINRQLKEKDLELQAADEIDFSCITDGDFPIEEMPRRLAQFHRHGIGDRDLHADVPVAADRQRLLACQQFAATGRDDGLVRDDAAAATTGFSAWSTTATR